MTDDDVRRRFQRLERPRAAGPAPEPGPGDAAIEARERFGAVERPGAPVGRAARSGAGLDRFGPAPEPRLELAEPADGDRPFVRCARCGADASPFATRCERCDADLGTPEQRAFSERFWAERQVQAARERAEEEARRAERDREASVDRRAMGEALARAVGDAERHRLAREGFGGAPWTSDGEPASLAPALVRILRAVEGPARWGALAAVIAVPGALFLSRSTFGLFLGIVVIVVLVAPPLRLPGDPP